MSWLDALRHTCCAYKGMLLPPGISAQPACCTIMHRFLGLASGSQTREMFWYALAYGVRLLPYLQQATTRRQHLSCCRRQADSSAAQQQQHRRSRSRRRCWLPHSKVSVCRKRMGLAVNCGTGCRGAGVQPCNDRADQHCHDMSHVKHGMEAVTKKHCRFTLADQEEVG